MNRFTWQRTLSYCGFCFFGGMAIELVKIHLKIGDIDFYSVIKKKRMQSEIQSVYQILKYRDASFEAGPQAFDHVFDDPENSSD